MSDAIAAQKQIVARFLKANHYTGTLDAFIAEAGLPPDAGTAEKGDLTLEKVLEEKQKFDLSFKFEKVGLDEGEKKWSLPAPSVSTQISLPSSTNLLYVSIEKLAGDSADLPAQLLLASTADRCLNFFSLDANFSVSRSLNHIQDSPVLSCLLADPKRCVTASSGMSGQIVMYDHRNGHTLDERRDHKKYVVKAAMHREEGRVWIATAGWDAKVFLYLVTDLETMKLGAPVATLTLTTNPETIVFVKHPHSSTYILLVSRRDSTSLLYYALPQIGIDAAQANQTSLELLGKQNLAPHSNAWIAFSPSSVAISPTDPTLLAVATSAVPHMRLILVRLLLPLLSTAGRPAAGGTATQLTQMRDELAIQDREEAAIQIQVNTSAPQTPYSTPQVVWRPNGTGVWVNGDDGVIRGVEAKTGKVVACLRDGHEVGSKIRSIWCGMVDVDGGEDEWVVSGGFDRRLIVWRPKKEDS